MTEHRRSDPFHIVGSDVGAAGDRGVGLCDSHQREAGPR